MLVVCIVTPSVGASWIANMSSLAGEQGKGKTMLSIPKHFHLLLANVLDSIDFRKVSTILILMTHVWIHPSPGKAIFIDDQQIPPCNECGKRLSVCRESDCGTNK